MCVLEVEHGDHPDDDRHAGEERADLKLNDRVVPRFVFASAGQDLCALLGPMDEVAYV